MQHVSFAEQSVDIPAKDLSAPLFHQRCANLMLGSSKHEIEGDVKISTIVTLPSFTD